MLILLQSQTIRKSDQFAHTLKHCSGMMVCASDNCDKIPNKNEKLAFNQIFNIKVTNRMLNKETVLLFQWSGSERDFLFFSHLTCFFFQVMKIYVQWSNQLLSFQIFFIESCVYFGWMRMLAWQLQNEEFIFLKLLYYLLCNDIAYYGLKMYHKIHYSESVSVSSPTIGISGSSRTTIVSTMRRLIFCSQWSCLSDNLRRWLVMLRRKSYSFSPYR